MGKQPRSLVSTGVAIENTTEVLLNFLLLKERDGDIFGAQNPKAEKAGKQPFVSGVNGLFKPLGS